MSGVYTLVSAPPKSYPSPRGPPGGFSTPGMTSYGSAHIYDVDRSKLGYKTAFKHNGFGGMTKAMRRAEEESIRFFVQQSVPPFAAADPASTRQAGPRPKLQRP